jgi:hypothetical protein
METFELPAPVDLPKARKDLADVLHGGQWFDDPMGMAKPPDTDDEPASEYGAPGAWEAAIKAISRGR